MTSQAGEQEAAGGMRDEIPGAGDGGEEESSQPLLAARATGFRSE